MRGRWWLIDNFLDKAWEGIGDEKVTLNHLVQLTFFNFRMVCFKKPSPMYHATSTNKIEKNSMFKGKCFRTWQDVGDLKSASWWVVYTKHMENTWLFQFGCLHGWCLGRKGGKRNTMPLESSNSTQTGRCSSGEIFLRFARSSQHVTVDGLELPNNHLRCINPLYMMAQNYLPPRISSIKSTIFVKLSVRKLQSNVDDRHLRTDFRNLAKGKIISLTPSSGKVAKLVIFACYAWRNPAILAILKFCNLPWYVTYKFQAILSFHHKYEKPWYTYYIQMSHGEKKLLLHFPLNPGFFNRESFFNGSFYSPHNWGSLSSPKKNLCNHMQRGDSHSTLPRNVNAPVGLTWRLGVGISYRRVYLEISRPPSAPALVKNFWFTWVFKVKNHLKNKSKFQRKSYSLPYPVIFEDVWGNHDLPTNFFKEKTTVIYWVPVLKLQPNLPPFFLGDNKKLSQQKHGSVLRNFVLLMALFPSRLRPWNPLEKNMGFAMLIQCEPPPKPKGRPQAPRKRPSPKETAPVRDLKMSPGPKMTGFVGGEIHQPPTNPFGSKYGICEPQIGSWNPTIFGVKIIQIFDETTTGRLRCFAAQRQQSQEGTRSWSNDRQSLCDSSLILLQMRFFKRRESVTS